MSQEEYYNSIPDFSGAVFGTVKGRKIKEKKKKESNPLRVISLILSIWVVLSMTTHILFSYFNRTMKINEICLGITFLIVILLIAKLTPLVFVLSVIDFIVMLRSSIGNITRTLTFALMICATISFISYVIKISKQKGQGTIK